MTVAKRVLRYVKGTLDLKVKFCASQNCILQGYFYSDHAGSLNDMKSTLGYCFHLESRVFSLCSKKQEIVAQSIIEVEFIATTVATNQA